MDKCRRLLVGLLAVLALFAPAHALAAEDLPQLAAKARSLANRLQEALDPDQFNVTMAVAILEGGLVIAASSEQGDYVRSPVKAIIQEEGIEVADGPKGCAERKIIRFVRGNLFYRKKKILVIAAGRKICEPCEKAILDDGAQPASPCRSGRRYL